MIVKARRIESEEFFFYDGTQESFEEFLKWVPPMYYINGCPQKGSVERRNEGKGSDREIWCSGWKQFIRIKPNFYVHKKSFPSDSCIWSEEKFKQYYKKTRK